MTFIIGTLLGSTITGAVLYKMNKQRGADEYRRGYEDCYDTYLDFRDNHREEYRKMSMSS